MATRRLRPPHSLRTEVVSPRPIFGGGRRGSWGGKIHTTARRGSTRRGSGRPVTGGATGRVSVPDANVPRRPESAPEPSPAPETPRAAEQQPPPAWRPPSSATAGRAVVGSAPVSPPFPPSGSAPAAPVLGLRVCPVLWCGVGLRFGVGPVRRLAAVPVPPPPRRGVGLRPWRCGVAFRPAGAARPARVARPAVTRWHVLRTPGPQRPLCRRAVAARRCPARRRGVVDGGCRCCWWPCCWSASPGPAVVLRPGPVAGWLGADPTPSAAAPPPEPDPSPVLAGPDAARPRADPRRGTRRSSSR